MEHTAEFLRVMSEQGYLDERQREACWQLWHEREESLYQIMVGGGVITAQDWARATEAFYGLPVIDLTPEMVDKNCLQSLPSALRERYGLVPYRQAEGRLWIAVSQRPSRELLEDMSLLNQRRAVFVLAEPEALEAVDFAMQLERSAQELLDDGRQRIYEIGRQTKEENLAAYIIDAVVDKALLWQASDIHLEAMAEEVLVKLRVDGFLRPIWHLPKGLHSALINRLKIMAEMDIAEKRLPQDGHIALRWRGQVINIRVSTLPFIYGEKAVLRLLGLEQSLLEVTQLGLDEDNLRKVRLALERPYGLILITGPTGSGKTTTLYSLLNELKGRGRNIVTIEDPVEYEQSGINQLQVNEKVGLTFAKGLRGILRQDPDIIMVGEIRDAETAAIAVRAANTGHMVLGSLHTNNAASAVLRLLEMGIEPFLVSASLIAVIAQRLVRRNCPHCRGVDEAGSRELCGLMGREAGAWRGLGCSWCHDSGFKGRMALQEVWLVEEGDRQAILSRDFLHQYENRSLYRSMREDGLSKIAQGETTLAEVWQATMTAED